MAANVIRRADWPRFVEAASAALHDAEVAIEIHSDEVREESWVPLHGISYDIADDVLWIHTGRVEHEIVRPSALRTLEDGGRLDALEIEGGEARWVLRFRVPSPV